MKLTEQIKACPLNDGNTVIYHCVSANTLFIPDSVYLYLSTQTLLQKSNYLKHFETESVEQQEEYKRLWTHLVNQEVIVNED